MAAIASYDAHIEQLIDVVERLRDAFEREGVEYRIVGGLAVFLYVRDRDPLAARSTRDVDVAVRREDLEKIGAAAPAAGFELRHAAGGHTLVNRVDQKARSAVHFVFLNERVQPDYLEPVPPMNEATRTEDGLTLVRLEDLVTMKLTSFRLKDQVHIQDLDGVGLITRDIESRLPASLAERLAYIRSQR